jgi:hypothetical protein
MAGRGGRLEDITQTRQMAFGRRKPFVRTKKERPLPRWQEIARERTEMADARKANDAVQDFLKSTNPNLDFFSQYGTVLRNDRVTKYSIDIAYDPRRARDRSAVFTAVKKLNDDIDKGIIPETFYYHTFTSPAEFMRARRTKHQGPVHYQTVKSRARGPSESFTPGGKKGMVEVSKQMRTAKTRVMLRERGVRLRPHMDKRISRWELQALSKRKPWWYGHVGARNV